MKLLLILINRVVPEEFFSYVESDGFLSKTTTLLRGDLLTQFFDVNVIKSKTLKKKAKEMRNALFSYEIEVLINDFISNALKLAKYEI